MTPQPQAEPAAFLIPAILTAAEAQEHRTRLAEAVAAKAGRVIEVAAEAGCTTLSAVSIQLCLATAASLRAQGLEPVYGPEARRLLSAQNL